MVMNSKELFDKLEVSSEKCDELLELIEIEKIKNYELRELVKSSLSFRTFDTVQILADLISIKENDSYGVLVSNKNTDLRGYRNVAIAISNYFGSSRAERKFAKSRKKLDDSQDYIIIYYSDMCHTDKDLNRLEYMTFRSLRNKYDLFNEYNGNTIYGVPNISCYNDFVDYSYVYDFIEYLFDLQVQNNGKQLIYEEMQKALNDFLELEKGIPKQKIKEKDKS